MEFNFVKNCQFTGTRFRGIVDAWNTYFQGNDLIISNLDIDSGDTTGEDGIHVLGGRNIIISNCHIRSGDDCVALVTSLHSKLNIENVVIDNILGNSVSGRILALVVQDTTDGTLSISRVVVSRMIGTGPTDATSNSLTLFDQLDDGLIHSISLSDIDIDCSDNGIYGAQIENVVEVLLRRLTMRSPLQHAFYISGCTKVQADYCRAIGPRQADNDGFHVLNSAGVDLVFPTSEGSPRDGIRYTGSTGRILGQTISGESGDPITVSDSTVTGSDLFD
jgi:hypothetical protein